AGDPQVACIGGPPASGLPPDEPLSVGLSSEPPSGTPLSLASPGPASSRMSTSPPESRAAAAAGPPPRSCADPGSSAWQLAPQQPPAAKISTARRRERYISSFRGL